MWHPHACVLGLQIHDVPWPGQGSLRHVTVEERGQEGPSPGLSRLQDWSPPSQLPCLPQGLPGNLDSLLASLFHQNHLGGIARPLCGQVPRPVWPPWSRWVQPVR